MDQGRLADLKRINARLADRSLTGSRRRQAHKAKVKIIAQLKDRNITKLRMQLIRATQATDENAQQTIIARLRAYERVAYDRY